MNRCAVILFCAAATFGPGCGSKSGVRLPPPAAAATGSTQTGVASWYGHPYHGRRTSSGEVYDMNRLTAAHLWLPFQTVVRVTNLTNQRSIDVRINDRGPFIKNRIIDLSREAARRIDMLGPGTARVRLQVLQAPVGAQPIPPGLAAGGSPQCPDQPHFGVQAGAFRQLENAQRMQGKMRILYGSSRIFLYSEPSGAIYRVIVGEEADSITAANLLRRLRNDGFEGFVRQIDAGLTRQCL